MPLRKDQVDPELRKIAGRLAAASQKATEPKPFGQTSEDVYPFTYWYVVGYNEWVGENK